ncbi:uncharacterized protein BP5553_07912 [Venustampulla echinocandica]|uniref:DNL-type domain-containing protein n=1 Tax=Venustampulla echinocandica TaxID=2656787 RepID=A0A370THW1_9HELO|nr:uncharacterized protein BP5553_07912 [Venustampulla echinocandica]RDL34784.1 hypothetical protein BP5553_07912 [Venustampulla echinocandica]
MPPASINSLSRSAFRTLSRNAFSLVRPLPTSTTRRLASIPLSTIRLSSNQSPSSENPVTSTSTNASVSQHNKKPRFAVPPPPNPPKPEYEMTFTCTPCSTRSTHRVSKQGYHFGSVLITCPECRNRHVISDHLNFFGDKNITLEDIMREKGQIIKKGTLSEDGNVEFWEDRRVNNTRSNPRSSEVETESTKQES